MSTRWGQIQNILENRIKPGIFKIWIKPLEGQVQEGSLELVAPNAFVASWVRDRYLQDIRSAATELLGFSPEVTLKASSDASVTAPPPSPPEPSTAHHTTTPAASQQRSEHLALPIDYSHVPQPQQWRHSFDDFIIGQCNQLAHAACTNLCRKTLPAESVFLSSGPGLGKTHLLHAVGHYYAQNQKNSQVRVGYVTAEEFANQMIMALKNRTIDTFKDRYRKNLDVLLLEDVHFFQGKEKIQEELLSTIKFLEQHGRKVVFSSSFLPKELTKVDNQLTSLFCSGFIAPIDAPDADMRLKIIQAKAQRFQIHIPTEVQEMVAENIHSDIRQLESCIKNMALKARLLNQGINQALAEEVLGHFTERCLSVPDIDSIISLICQNFNLSGEKLRSKSRKRQIVVARNTAFYLARKHTDLSLKDIGTRFNRRHSTVLKGITNLEREIQRDSQVGRQAIRIEERLNA